MNTRTLAATVLAAAGLLGACASSGPAPSAAAAAPPAASQPAPQLPAAVSPPAGHKFVMNTTGVGEITYECRAKAGVADAFEWVFIAPVATLYDSGKKVAGKYYAGPTWEHNDGSRVSGKQLAVSPAQPGNIPLQLVQAGPATGQGWMQGVTYIQRHNTVGGVAPSEACNAQTSGQRRVVKYQADYAFYKAA